MFTRSTIRRALIFNKTFVRLENTTAYNEAIANIRNDLKINFRAKADVMEKNVIRAILSEVKNLEIKNNNKRDNDKFQLYELFSKMIKERENSAKEYFAEGNPDRFHRLGDNELREVEYIKKYINALDTASNEEIEDKLTKIIEEVEKDGDEVNLKNIYKKIPLKSVELEWNCSRLQIKQVLNKLLNLD